MKTLSNMIESLEDRRLLSAAISVVVGTLIVRGTPRADEIVVAQAQAVMPVGTASGNLISAATNAPWLVVTINGRQRSISTQNISRVRVEAGAGDDSVIMTHSNDALAVVDVEQLFPSIILGGAGNDTLIGGRGADSISGGAGRDSINGEDGNDTLDGDANSDSITGGSGTDLIRGGTGDDRISHDQLDSVLGGAGIDFTTQSDATLLRSFSTRSTSIDVEGVITTPAAGAPDVTLEGDTILIRGTRRADKFTLYNQADGRLMVVVNNRAMEHLPTAGINRIRIEAGNGDDTMIITTSIKQPLELIGGDGNDTMLASDGKDLLQGGAGDDILLGGNNDDTLDGGDGHDTLRGNAGNDVLLNGEDNDQDADFPLGLGTVN